MAGQRDAATNVDAAQGPMDAFVPGEDSGPPPIEEDAGPSCSESPCRLVAPQCGCPAGQGCYTDNNGNRGCITASAEQEGEPCTGPCAPGNICVGAGSSSLCARFCESDADCTGGPGSLCLLTLVDGSENPIAKLCSTNCSPAGGGCPSGLGCGVGFEEDGLMRVFTNCRPAGAGRAGDPCSSGSDCADGHFCAETSSGPQCIEFCTVPAGTECTRGFCNRFEDDPLVIGGVEYGYCL